MRRWIGVLVVSLAVPSFADEGAPVPAPAPVPAGEPRATDPPPPPPPLELTEPLLRAFREVIERVPAAATADPVDPAWLVPSGAAGSTVPTPEGVSVVVLDVPMFVAIRSEVAWAQHAVAELQSVQAERERLEAWKKAVERAKDGAQMEKDIATELAQANAKEEEWKPKDEVERRNVERMRGATFPRMERRFFPSRRAPRPVVAAYPGWPFVAPGEKAPSPAPPPPVVPDPPKEKKPRHRPAVLLTDDLLAAYVKIRARARDAGRLTPDPSWFAGEPFDASGYATLHAEVRWELEALSWLEDWAKRRKVLDETLGELGDWLAGGAREVFDHYQAVLRDLTQGDESAAWFRPTDDDRERQNRERAIAWRARLEALVAPAPAK